MKEEIKKRKMFSKPMSKASKNSGIMAGFEDMEPEEDEMQPMARSPQNPEILMNNLRGDFRSVDARYAELAQMVGEEAAGETPPEVLAMLQPQLAAPAAPPQPPSGGIGALPQAAGMAPPQPGQGGGIPMPEGMPPGMEGAPPFPQGGADNAPPTPDGLPPLRAAAGSFVANMLRGGYDLGKAGVGKVVDEGRMVANAVGERVGPYISQADQYFGNMLPPSMRASVMRGEDGKPIVLQAKESLIPGPGNSIVGQGEGSKLVKAYTAEAGNPRFSQVVKEQIAQNPNATAGIIAGGTLLGGMTSGNEIYDKLTQKRLMTPAPNQAEIDARVASIPGQVPRNVPVEGPLKIDIIGRSEMPPDGPASAPTDKLPTEAPAKKEKTTSQFIKDNFEAEKERGPSKTREQRIREGYDALSPIFKSILGEDKDAVKANALFLLADAGFKFASNARPTMAAALSDSLSGMPRGFAAILAQSKERETRIKTAALEQAITDVNLQDKYAMQFQLESLKGLEKRKLALINGDYELLKKQMEEGGRITEDGGMGLRTFKTRKGSYLGQPTIDPEDPVVKNAIGSDYTLRPTDNPFVENRGKAPTTMITDKAQRLDAGKELNALDSSLNSLNRLKGRYTEAYSPGTWVVDKVNNILVPISAGTIAPNLDQDAAVSEIRLELNGIMKQLAAANPGDRVSNKEQEWAREMMDSLNNPTAFFENKERAAKQFATMDTVLRNRRQGLLTQLGYEGNDYVMKVPNVGTQNDPFVMPGDPDDQKRMFTYLGSTIGRVQDERATVYIRLPNGRVDPFRPSDLRALNQR